MDDFSPEVVTGLRIGDPIPNGNPAPGIDADGVFRLELVPIWVPAVLEDLVVGYLKKDDLFGFGDDPTSPAQNYVPVYDNNGSQIGIMGPTGVTIFNA